MEANKELVEKFKDSLQSKIPWTVVPDEAATACATIAEEYAREVNADLVKENEKLKKELDGWIRYKQNIDEALNSGDGVYRP